ncbi:putative reverse transcriptase zinc-binding domain-containing protein [Helianthus anomalus]
MWVKVVDAIHSGGSGWSFLPVRKALGGVWNNIAMVINKPFAGSSRLRDYFRGSVGRGDSILFWLDPWLMEVPLKEAFRKLFALEIVKTCSALNEAIGLISLNDRKDEWIWSPDKSGSFSVKSVKHVLEGVSNNVSNYVVDWCKWVPIKCNMFVWRAELNRIPTFDALRRRGITVSDEMCPLCKMEFESVEHLFTSCVTAVVLWQKISRWCRIAPIYAFSFRDLLEVHKGSSISAKDKVIIQGIIFISCWCLWLARNRAVFSDSEIKVEGVFSEVRSLGYLWFKHRSKSSSVSWLDWCNFVNM